MINEQIITVTLKDDQTRGTVQIQDEPVRVEVYPAGPPGPGGGGEGDGVDLVARQKAEAARALAATVQTDLQSHRTAAQPHSAYDQDIPDLSLIFKNGLI